MNIESVWAQYRQNLKAFLHNNVSQPNDVEDLLQEILIKSYQNLGKVKDAKKVKSWLFQIANHAIIDFYRKRGANPDLAEEQLWYTHQEDTDLYGQLSQCVLPFIEGLPQEQAQLLSAIEIDGVSQKDYAALHGMKYSTLKSRVQKSRQNLYQLFSACCVWSVNDKGDLVDYKPRQQSCPKC